MESSDFLANSFIKRIEKTNYLIKEGVNYIVQEIKDINVLIFAARIYFYKMNG